MVFEKLRDMLSEQLGLDKARITPESDIVKDLGADSLEIVGMLMDVENEWNITIEDDDVHGFKTVGDVAKYIEKQFSRKTTKNRARRSVFRNLLTFMTIMCYDIKCIDI